jgi:co-chaperonin GroES (HSP10)
MTVSRYNCSIEEIFPETVSIGRPKPAGHRLLIQLRRPPEKKGSLIIPQDSKDLEMYRSHIGKILEIGPTAYTNEKGEAWAGGAWVKEGDFVRFPAHGGDRFEWPIKGSEANAEGVTLVICNDNSVTATDVDPFVAS